MDKEDIKLMGNVILIATILMACLLSMMTIPSIIFEQNYCKTMIRLNSNFEFRWELWGGCLVQTPSGYWIHASEYKYLEGNIQENK